MNDLLNGTLNISEKESLTTTWYSNEIISSIEYDECISSVEFNQEGNLVAYGNSEGQINIYEVDKLKNLPASDIKTSRLDVYGSLISHELEFDYLNSSNIEPRINHLSWLPRASQYNAFLSSNDFTIKLWKVKKAPAYKIVNLNFIYETGSREEFILRSSEDLRVPKFEFNSEKHQIQHNNKCKFQRGHKYPITGITTLLDGENFLSSDSFFVNLWNFNDPSNVFSIRQNEVKFETPFITCLASSKKSPFLFTYGDNTGSINVFDLRTNALCDNSSMHISNGELDEKFSIKKFLAYISDIKFSNTCDQYIVVRNFLQVLIYDLRKPDKPQKTYDIHPEIMRYITNLWNHETGGFDRFKFSISHDDKFIATGSYGTSFKIIDLGNSECPVHDLEMKKPYHLDHDPFQRPEMKHIGPDPVKSKDGKDKRDIDVEIKWLLSSFSSNDYTLMAGNETYLNLLEGIK